MGEEVEELVDLTSDPCWQMTAREVILEVRRLRAELAEVYASDSTKTREINLLTKENRDLRASLTRAEAALDAFWRHHRCHRIGDATSYCGYCDGGDTGEDASWREAPHEDWCAFANVISRDVGESGA